MLDRVEITVKAGDGGSGAISFRREKFVPFGGPDGGDGGRGGDVVIKATGRLDSLDAFKRKRFFRAASGGGGKSKKRHGKDGEDLILEVPVGTVVTAEDQPGEKGIIADLDEAGQEVVVARGGRGGLGNPHFASATYQVPRMALRGEAGEQRTICLELRLIADVGIIGYPNAGKSTLLAGISRASPEIASYPFTTIEPALGVAEVDGQRMVLAEIPGLIDGAHLGKGLGHDFLRHSLRTRALIHLVDGSLPSPSEAMMSVNNELYLFDSSLRLKPQLVAVNKIDLPSVRARQSEIKEDFSRAGIEVYFVAAATGEGVPQLMRAALEILRTVQSRQVAAGVSRKVFRPQGRDASARVEREGDTFIIRVAEPVFLSSRRGTPEEEREWQLQQQVQRLGLSRALEKAGIKPGDRVRWGQFEWEWR